MPSVINMPESVSIAIHSLVLIGSSRTFLSATDISNRTQTSRHHVSKVLQLLVKAGFISSQRGATGGFVLARDPATINFLQIFEAAAGPIETQNCQKDYHVCPFDKCLMNGIVSRLSAEFKAYLQNQILSDYIEIH